MAPRVGDSVKGDVFGDTMNVCARLVALHPADPDSGQTVGLSPACDAAGAFPTIKGKAEEVR